MLAVGCFEGLFDSSSTMYSKIEKTTGAIENLCILHYLIR